MNIYNRRDNIRYITLLFKLTNILAITPRYSFSKAKIISVRCSRFYSVFGAAIIITGSIFSFYGKSTIYKRIKVTIMVVDIIKQTSSTLLNLVSVLGISFFNLKNYSRFLNLLSTIDDKFSQNLSYFHKSKRNILYFELMCFHIFLGTVYIFDISVKFSKRKSIAFSFYMFEIVQYYHSYVAILLIYNFSMVIKDRFEKVNESLLKLKRCISNPNYLPLQLFNTETKTKNIKDILSLYTKICESVRLFNKIFGLEILLITHNLVLSVLSTLNVGLIHTFFKKSRKPNKQTVGIEFFLLYLVWSIVFLVSLTFF